jgi:hypothetical protein
MSFAGVPTVLLAAVLVLLPGLAVAQFPPPPPPAGAPPQVRDRWPEPAARPQAEPASPQAQRPARRPAAEVNRNLNGDNPDAPKPKAKPQPRTPANVIACSGVFAKDSAHLKLAVKYDSRNIAFGPVDGPDGSKLNASILFPNDPRRRLEVLWNNEASRSETSIIAINGRSQWVAPKGLKLGLTLAALEKANGKPFKLTGFGADGSSSVAGWEGGALSQLPGGCKVGMRLGADQKAPEAARKAVAGDKEMLSSDAAVRAINPTVVEILIGY